MFIKCPNCHKDVMIDKTTIRILKNLYMSDLVRLQEENKKLREEVERQTHRADVMTNERTNYKNRYLSVFEDGIEIQNIKGDEVPLNTLSKRKRLHILNNRVMDMLSYYIKRLTFSHSVYLISSHKAIRTSKEYFDNRIDETEREHLFELVKSLAEKPDDENLLNEFNKSFEWFNSAKFLCYEEGRDEDI